MEQSLFDSSRYQDRLQFVHLTNHFHYHYMQHDYHQNLKNKQNFEFGIQ